MFLQFSLENVFVLDLIGLVEGFCIVLPLAVPSLETFWFWNTMMTDNQLLKATVILASNFLNISSEALEKLLADNFLNYLAREEGR